MKPLGTCNTRRIYHLFSFFLLLCVFSHPVSGEDHNIGVLSLRGPADCLESWHATAEYLSEKIDGHSFFIVPVSFDDIEFSIENRQIDFLISNPYIYSIYYLENEIYSIATMIKKQAGIDSQTFGGVIFSKKPLSFTMSDINNYDVAAVHEMSFGGWQVSVWELEHQGIRIKSEVDFLNTHDAVVFSVLHDENEIGFVRTGILESMHNEGKINKNDFFVLHNHPGSVTHLPFLHSTREYPEWPIAALSHVDSGVVKQVTLTLLEIDESSEALKDAGIGGWVPPLNYSVLINRNLKETTSTQKPSLGAFLVCLVSSVLFFSSLVFLLSKKWISRKKDNYYKFLFNHMTSGLVIYEPVDRGEDFIIKNINEAGLKIVQKSPAIIGQRLLDVFPGAPKMGLVKCLKECSLSGENQFLPLKQYTEGDYILWAENRVFKLDNGDLVVVYDDQTAYHDLQEQMKQVEKMDTMGKLAGGIAHDFNNILSGVFGYVELSLELVEDNSLLKKYLDNILTAANRAEKLVTQILAFSRKKESTVNISHINEIITEILDFIKVTFPKSIKISTQLSDEISLVEVDSTRIHEAIINLLTNARDAMNGRGEVFIRTDEWQVNHPVMGVLGPVDPGVYVRIRLKDSGYGIKESQLEKIFEPFFSTKPEGKGTGLGLAVVFSVMQEHKGNLMVSSRIGKGTEFCLLLPVTEAQVQIQDNSKLAEVKKNLTIMVIDDEPDILNVFQVFFEKMQEKVDCFENGEAAIAAFEKNPSKYDLVISDYQLRSLTGKEIALNIKRINPDIPFYICSGNSSEIDQENLEEYGIKKILKKPCSQQDLLKLLNDI